MATKQAIKKKTAKTAKTTGSKTNPKTKVSTANKRNTVKTAVSQKVDYYPNRMTVAVSALAGSVLVLFAVIAVLGSR